MTYSGFHINLETSDSVVSQFVIPAILGEAVAAMIASQMATDPQDKMTLKICWGQHYLRPAYTVEEANSKTVI